jgi:hypothetical protein
LRCRCRLVHAHNIVRHRDFEIAAKCEARRESGHLPPAALVGWQRDAQALRFNPHRLRRSVAHRLKRLRIVGTSAKGLRDFVGPRRRSGSHEPPRESRARQPHYALARRPRRCLHFAFLKTCGEPLSLLVPEESPSA